MAKEQKPQEKEKKNCILFYFSIALQNLIAIYITYFSYQMIGMES